MKTQTALFTVTVIITAIAAGFIWGCSKGEQYAGNHPVTEVRTLDCSQ